MSPFQINHEADAAPNGAITSDRRLYLTADEKTAVEEGDERARFLLAAPGHTIPAEKAKQLGLSVEDSKVVLPAAVETDDDFESKQQGKKSNKSRTPGENK